jgi:hypothetical protein
MMRVAGILAAGLLALAAPAAAQDPTGTIEGTVTDASSAAVQGARVRATHLDTGFTRDAVAGVDGFYRLLLLPVGPYRTAPTASPSTRSASPRWSRSPSR